MGDKENPNVGISMTAPRKARLRREIGYWGKLTLPIFLLAYLSFSAFKAAAPVIARWFGSQTPALICGEGASRHFYWWEACFQDQNGWDRKIEIRIDRDSYLNYRMGDTINIHYCGYLEPGSFDGEENFLGSDILAVIWALGLIVGCPLAFLVRAIQDRRLIVHGRVEFAKVVEVDWNPNKPKSKVITKLVSNWAGSPTLEFWTFGFLGGLEGYSPVVMVSPNGKSFRLLERMLWEEKPRV